jgi:hypothetical protein
MIDPKHRLTAADFDPEILKLFDQFVHGLIDRRGFLDKAARYATAGGMTAAGWRTVCYITAPSCQGTNSFCP